MVRYYEISSIRIKQSCEKTIKIKIKKLLELNKLPEGAVRPKPM